MKPATVRVDRVRFERMAGYAKALVQAEREYFGLPDEASGDEHYRRRDVVRDIEGSLLACVKNLLREHTGPGRPAGMSQVFEAADREAEERQARRNAPLAIEAGEGR